MKIVTLNPPYLPMYSRASRSPGVTKSSTLYYPIFLSYTTGVLESDENSVTLIDAPASNMDRPTTIKEISKINPDIVICDTSTPSIENDLEVMREIKNTGVRWVVAVGTHVSALPEQALENAPWIDAICRHEYEFTARQFTREVRNNKNVPDLSRVEGLSHRIHHKTVHNPDRPYIENLDKLPFVSETYYQHLRPHLNSYFYGANLHPVMSILSGRGCPHHCAYCVYPQTMTGHKYRLRSIDNLVDELEYIGSVFPEVKEVFIEDDTLTANKERVRRIAEEIINRDLKITWSTNSRADTDYETMRAMKKSGCRLLCVGFESGVQEILNKLKKNINLRQYFDFVKDAKRAGILVHGCFMYGNEGETRQSMRQTLELAKELNCDTAQFYPIMVYPGTRAYMNYKAAGYITASSYREWLTDDGLHNCVVSIPGISKDELVSFSNLSRREYYFRPKYILSKIEQIIKHPREAKRIYRAGKSMMKHLFINN